jgi:uncharacterized protein
MISLFGKTKELVLKIDSFIDLTVNTALHLSEGIREYMNDRMEDFEKRAGNIIESENTADDIRKDVEAQLYSQTLIPESRGDVLGVLESMDVIVDTCKSTIFEFSIEKPDIPREIKNDIMDLTDLALKSVEALAFGARSFFYDVYSVKDHLQIVKFYEKECDILAEKIKRKVFSLDLELSHKMQIKGFIYRVDSLADAAEGIADRLGIATIKRIV